MGGVGQVEKIDSFDKKYRMKDQVGVQKESRTISSARSGGDALPQRDCRRPLLHKDEKSLNLKDAWNARNEGVKVDRHGAGQPDWIDKIASCPVYFPTEEEFGDPLQYIQNIAAEASEYGMCKIVSPLMASVPAGMVLMKEQSGFKFTTRVQPMRLSNWDKDDKTTFPMSGRHYTLTEYEKVANKVFSRNFSTAAALPPKFIEAEFWKELVAGKTQTVEYACDVEGSAFSESSLDSLGQSKWNLKGISRLPNSILRLLNVIIPGVTEPMLYIGMLFSMFAWHIEDHYLYSINYHHCGAPKTWYGVPGNSAPDFEKIVQEHVYDSEMLKDAGKGVQFDLLLGKTTMFAPKLLSEHGVPVFRAVQNPGEFVITFPRAYHAGFSHGFNCGEAVNFAMADWFSFGAAACLRYEFLNRIPLLPHEELLCKEAMEVSQIDRSSVDAARCKQQNFVKVAFVTLMRSQIQAHAFLKQRGAKVMTSNFPCVHCGLCKHTCYIAYTICKCFPEPTCVNHERVFNGCMCGNDRSLVVRDDTVDLQAVAQKYECEDGILNEVLRGPSICDTFVKGAGSGVGEEMHLQQRFSSAGAEADDGQCKTDWSGGKRKNFSDGNNGVLHSETRAGVRSSDCKPVYEEESSDSEVFRVKRRRVIPSRSQRFQVDEQILSPKKLPKKYLVTGLGNKKDVQTTNENVQIDRKERMCESMKGYSVRVTDVINELGLEGSKEEVMERWQHDARRQGMSVKVKQVSVADELVEALSLKSCKYLKQILPKEQGRRLQLLMEQVRRPTTVSLVNSSCSIQADNDEAVSGVISCKETAVSVSNNDFHERVHKSIFHSRGTLSEAFSDDDVNSCFGSIKEKVTLNRKQHSLQGEGNMDSGEKQVSIIKSTDNGNFFHEGLLNDIDPHHRKQNQKVSRLKVKGPTPPIPMGGISSLVKGARQTDYESKSEGCIDEKAVQCTNFDACMQLHDANGKNRRDLSSGQTAQTKLFREHGKERTEIILGSEQRKILIVHHNRRADLVKGASYVDREPTEGQDKSNDFGMVLKLAQKTEALPATSWCSREALSACTSAAEHQTADTLGTSNDSMKRTPVAEICLKESDLPVGSLLEEGELREEHKESRNHVHPQCVDNALSQELEHTVLDFTSKRLPVGSLLEEGELREEHKESRNHVHPQRVDNALSRELEHTGNDFTSEIDTQGSVRQMKSSARSSLGGRLEHGFLGTRLAPKEGMQVLPTENLKDSFCHFGAPVGCATGSNLKNHRARSPIENQRAVSCHRQRETNNGFCRLSCQDENLLGEKSYSQHGSQTLCGYSVNQAEEPGNNDLKESLHESRNQTCTKDEVHLDQKTRSTIYGEVQNSSTRVSSSVVRDRCRTACNSHRFARTMSRKKPLYKPKSSHQSRHYSRMDYVKDPHSFEGQEKMPYRIRAEKFGNYSWGNDDEMEGKFCTDSDRTNRGSDRSEGVISNNRSPNEVDGHAEWQMPSRQKYPQYCVAQNSASFVRPGRTS